MSVHEIPAFQPLLGTYRGRHRKQLPGASLLGREFLQDLSVPQVLSRLLHHVDDDPSQVLAHRYGKPACEIGGRGRAADLRGGVGVEAEDAESWIRVEFGDDDDAAAQALQAYTAACHGEELW